MRKTIQSPDVTVYERLARIESQIDSALNRQELVIQHAEVLLTRSETNTNRITALERWQSRVNGMVLAISSVAGATTAWLSEAARKFSL